jgi:hypothetical protein
VQADDTDRARQFQLSLVNSQSPLSWGASILASVFTISFFVLFVVVLTTPLKENSVVMAFVGTLTAGMIQILGYFFGSSAGSKNSADRFATLAQQVVDKPNPSPAVVDAIKAGGGKSKQRG